jgi:hypothetical protein
MWSNAIAVQLRNRGRNVEAVVERPELRSLIDPAILAIAHYK